VKTWFETSRSENTLPKSAEYKVESRTIVIVERTRQWWDKNTHEIQYYLTSLPDENPRIGSAIRLFEGNQSFDYPLEATTLRL
jgi:hypothetical protein